MFSIDRQWTKTRIRDWKGRRTKSNFNPLEFQSRIRPHAVCLYARDSCAMIYYTYRLSKGIHASVRIIYQSLSIKSDRTSYSRTVLSLSPYEQFLFPFVCARHACRLVVFNLHFSFSPTFNRDRNCAIHRCFHDSQKYSKLGYLFARRFRSILSFYFRVVGIEWNGNVTRRNR